MHLQDSNDPQEELNIYLNNVLIVESFVDTAIRLGVDSMRSFETILSRVNDDNNGIYRSCLEKLRSAEDNSKNNGSLSIQQKIKTLIR